jgi:hypothetical protein
VSLIQTLVNKYGAWQCADHRIVDLKSRAISDDFADKAVPMICPDGAILLAYAGVGTIFAYRPQRLVHLSEWVRGLWTGAAPTMLQALELLRDNATADLGELFAAKHDHHRFVVAAFITGGQPCLFFVDNFANSAEPLVMAPVRREFTIAGNTLQAMGHEAAYIAFPPILLPEEVEPVSQVMRREPATAEQFPSILADINRRVAQRLGPNGAICEHCTVISIPPAARPVSRYPFFMPPGAPLMAAPLLLFGIDLTAMQNTLLERMIAQREGREEPPDRSAEWGPASVRPKNPLRDP